MVIALRLGFGVKEISIGFCSDDFSLWPSWGLKKPPYSTKPFRVLLIASWLGFGVAYDGDVFAATQEAE